MAYTKKQIDDWFRDKAYSATGYRRNILGKNERARDAVTIGKMYFFAYDPKLKGILPVYDKFPLVFPIEGYNDGFLGLNLHYLNVDERSMLLENLKKYATDDRMNKNTRLQLSYSLLNSTKRLASPARPCIKRYLLSQLRSRFIEITSNEWDKAILLPVAQFVYK